MNLDALFKKVFDKTSEVRLAPQLETLHIAYCKVGDVNIFVHKDRGWEHLLFYLCSDVLGDVSIKEFADSNYQPVGISTTEPVELFLSKHYCSIIFINGVFVIRVEKSNKSNQPQYCF